ncbi:RNA polymerase factor sigma-54 [Rhodovibrionaceae bacterium A322]
MAISQRLDLRQSQNLVMTPQLQQAIKLLQLTNQELASFVEGELNDNPLLERDDSQAAVETPLSESDGFSDPLADTSASPSADFDSSSDGAGDAAGDAGGDVGGEEAALPDALDHAASDALSGNGDQPLDHQDSYDDNSPSDQWDAAANSTPGEAGPGVTSNEAGPGEDGLGGDWGSSSGSGGSPFDEDGSSFEERMEDRPSLREHLLSQLQLESDDTQVRLIGAYLIDSLNETGYLAIELVEVAEALGCDISAVEAVLDIMRGFDPVGVFARDLRDCLEIQLIDKDRFDPYMQRLLENLELLASHDFVRLRKICGVDEEDFSDMLAELKALDPRPALAYEGGAAEPVIPDVLMRPRPDGSWHIELNSQTLPRVLVNQAYYGAVISQCHRKEDKAYLNDQLQSASWLVKALHQRANTIIKVAGEIVRQQEAFFSKGVEHMRPMTLRTVADAIEMHESTVSRVTSNKYIATPRGTYELKYFFSTAIAGTGGGEHSSESVRHRIRALIDAETVKTVLSDDALVEKLKAEGIDIARRTVAKYREGMNIPSSVQRRRLKKVGR